MGAGKTAAKAIHEELSKQQLFFLKEKKENKKIYSVK
jgi:hypothetical protein